MLKNKKNEIITYYESQIDKIARLIDKISDDKQVIILLDLIKNYNLRIEDEKNKV